MEAKGEIGQNNPNLAETPSVFATIHESMKQFEKKKIETGIKLKALDEQIKLVWSHVLQDRESVEQLSQNLKKSAADYEIECIKRNEMANKSNCTAAMFEAQSRFQTEILTSVDKSTEELKICLMTEKQRLKELNDFQKQLDEVCALHMKSIQEIPNKAVVRGTVEIKKIQERIHAKKNVLFNFEENLTNLMAKHEELLVTTKDILNSCNFEEEEITKDKVQYEKLKEEKQHLDLSIAKAVENIKNDIDKETTLIKEASHQIEFIKIQLTEKKIQKEKLSESKIEYEHSIKDINDKMQAQVKKLENLLAELDIKEKIKEMLNCKISDMDEVKNKNIELKQDEEIAMTEIEKLNSEFKESFEALNKVTELKENQNLYLTDIKNRHEKVTLSIEEIELSINHITEDINKITQLKEKTEKTYEEETKCLMNLEVNNIMAELNQFQIAKDLIKEEYDKACLVPEDLKLQYKSLEEKKDVLQRTIEGLKEEQKMICDNFKNISEERKSVKETIDYEIVHCETVVAGMNHLDTDLKELEKALEMLHDKYIQDKEIIMSNHTNVKEMQEKETEIIKLAFNETFVKLDRRLKNFNDKLNEIMKRNGEWRNKLDEKEKRTAESKKKMEALEASITNQKDMLIKMRHTAGITWKDIQT